MNGHATTIFALSSGALPCAIAIIRISGPDARSVAGLLGFDLPDARRAELRTLRDGARDVLDRGLVLFFPKPQSATGEDVLELHVHGSRAGVRAVLGALARDDRLRPADAGEFTRRALLNGRLDLLEAEALGDLLAAETETQRRRAIAAPSSLSNTIDRLRADVLHLSAALEAAIDHDEDLDEAAVASIREHVSALQQRIMQSLEYPSATRLRDGFRVVIAGPPNAGKSTLLNRLVGWDAAITSAIPGTTRDIIDVASSLGSVPIRLIDTAGLRSTGDEIEAIGVARAADAIAGADVLVWLSDAPPPETAAYVISVAAKSDSDAVPASSSALPVSALTGEGIADLKDAIVSALRDRLPPESEALWNDRQRDLLRSLSMELIGCAGAAEIVLMAEHLRVARTLLDRVVGRAGLEEMLDTIFAQFCLGK